MNYENVFKREELKQIELKLDLLTEEQLDLLTSFVNIFDTIGISARITDYAIALGGCAAEEKYYERKGYWHTKDNITVRPDNRFWQYENIYSTFGLRPFLYYSSIASNCICRETLEYDDKIIEYGEYPQWACSIEQSEILEKLYKNEKLKTTGKVYTRIENIINDSNFDIVKNIEYEYCNKKYVRVGINLNSSIGCRTILSNRHIYENGDYIWIHVSPIEWIVVEDIALAANIIVSNIPTSFEEDYMNEFLSKEILAHELFKKSIQINTNIQKKPNTLLDALKYAEEEMNEILDDTTFQKIKK